MNLLFATATICLAVMVPVLLSLRRSGGPGIETFCLAGSLATLSFGLTAATDLVLPQAAKPAASFLLMAACLLILSGFRRFLGRPAIALGPLAILLTGSLVLLALLGLADNAERLQATFRSGATGVLMLLVGVTILRHWPKDRSLSPHMLFCCVAGLAAAIFQAVHISGLVLFYTGTNPLLGTALTTTRAISIPLVLLGVILAQQGWIISELRLRVARDDLTGILSRRAFIEQYEDVLASSRTSKTPLALLLLDLDRFKQINDRHGHAGGDAALLHFVAVVRPALSDRAIFGRLGGEEFGVVVTDIDILKAVGVAEHLCDVVRKNPVRALDGTTIAMTVSVGVAMAQPEDTAAVLMHRADTALYDAKATGRDRFAVAESSESTFAASTRALAGAAAQMRAALATDDPKTSAIGN